MKKLLFSLIFLMLSLASLLPLPADAEGDGFTYTIINGRAIIIGFTGSPEHIVIPPELEGFPVTEIRDNAFYDCRSLRDITIPETVTVMGHHCFYACNALEKVLLPESLRTIGMGSFCGCSSLTSVQLPEDITVLPDSCFRACTSLKSIIIPQSVTVIEKFCFSGCTSLEFISLSGELQELGDYALYMCSSLDELYIPSSVTVFGDYAVGFMPDEKGYLTASDIIISGEKGSAAMTYANEHGLRFSGTDALPVFSFLKGERSPSGIPAGFIITGIALFSAVLAIAVRMAYREGR